MGSPPHPPRVAIGFLPLVQPSVVVLCALAWEPTLDELVTLNVETLVAANERMVLKADPGLYELSTQRLLEDYLAARARRLLFGDTTTEIPR